MKPIITILCFAVAICFAQESTIDINLYKKSKKYAYAEKSYTVGKHTFRVVNIKPLMKPRAASSGESDTACISAIILDKRKYVLFDVDILSASAPLGMVVPARQPIAGGLVILKASPYEGKTFLLLSGGKVVTLPGASTIIDTVGKCVYCVWDNDRNFKLTVFDYKGLRLVINTTDIAEPKQWFSTGMDYCFMAADSKTWYTIGLMTKSITKSEKPGADLNPVSYFGDIEKLDKSKCCGADVLKK